MKRLIMAVSIVALVAMPAFASVQNVKVGGSINSTYLHRDQFDLGVDLDTGGVDANPQGTEQSLLITQTLLKINADLTDNVSTTVRLLNERAWGEIDVDGADSGDIDLNLAYVTLREMLYSPLTVQIGRQELFYGNGLVVGNGTNNLVTQGGLNGVAEDLSLQTAFDAVKLVLDYNPLTIDVFAAKVDANTLTGGGDRTNDEHDLYGINAHYKLGDSRNTELEGYFFSRIDNSVAVEAAATGIKADTVYTPGLRASTNPIKGLNVQAEVAWQRGNKSDTNTAVDTVPDNQQREAMAAQVIASYAISQQAVAKWSPVVSGWATHLSGDRNGGTASDVGSTPSSSEKFTAWDPMHEGQSGGTIYNTLFNYSNVNLFGGSLQVTPIEDVIAKATFTGLWLDRDVSSNAASGADDGQGLITLNQPDGSTRTVNVTSNKHLGNELDLGVTYNYTEDVQFGVNAGWFFPGSTFVVAEGDAGIADNHEIASQLLANVNVNF